VALFEVIHSVDIQKLGAELSKWGRTHGKRQGIFLEVNVSGEASNWVEARDLESTLTEINKPRVSRSGL